jgi:hypothetical protein
MQPLFVVFCYRFLLLMKLCQVFLKEHAPFIDELKHNKLRIKLHLRVIFLVAATVSCLLLSLLAVDAAAAGVLE